MIISLDAGKAFDIPLHDKGRVKIRDTRSLSKHNKSITQKADNVHPLIHSFLKPESTSCFSSR